MSSVIRLPSGDETSLQQAVAYVGPVSVAVDADNTAFRVRESSGRGGLTKAKSLNGIESLHCTCLVLGANWCKGGHMKGWMSETCSATIVTLFLTPVLTMTQISIRTVAALSEESSSCMSYNYRQWIHTQYHITSQSLYVMFCDSEMASSLYFNPFSFILSLFSLSIYTPPQYYYQGVYSSSRCSSSDVNHGMVVTGYGSTGGSDFWLVKNR